MKMLPEGNQIDIAARLVAEIETFGGLPFKVVIVDGKTGRRYKVEVKETSELNEERIFEHRTYISAGPAGTPCECCNGTGRRNG